MTGFEDTDPALQSKRPLTGADLGANRQIAEELAAIWRQATPDQRQEIVAFIAAQIREIDELHDLLTALSPAAWRAANQIDAQPVDNGGPND